MVREAVEQRGGHLGITENGRPFTEGEIGRDDDRGTLVEAADQVEQQLAARLRERQITQLVEDDEVEAGEIVGKPTWCAISQSGANCCPPESAASTSVPRSSSRPISPSASTLRLTSRVSNRTIRICASLSRPLASSPPMYSSSHRARPGSTTPTSSARASATRRASQKGGQFWTQIGGRFCAPIDNLH